MDMAFKTADASMISHGKGNHLEVMHTILDTLDSSLDEVL